MSILTKIINILKVSRDKDLEIANLKKRLYWDNKVGCYSKAYLEDEADPIFNQPAAVILMDVDGLKTVNDTQGHSAGDHLLKGFVNSISKAVRFGDILIRIGGDEFLLIIPAKDMQYTHQILVRLQDSVPFSFGWALKPRGGNISGAIQLADEIMYANKRKRKGM